MAFKLEIRLDRLAAIAFATSFVKDFPVHSILQEHAKREVNFSIFPVQDLESFKKLIKDNIKGLKNMGLPRIVLKEVVCVIEPLLVNCIKWHAEVREMFGFDYLGKIYWTCYGTIDTAKIVKEEWTSWFDDNGAGNKNNIRDSLQLSLDKSTVICLRFAMYYMACSCVLTSYIESHCSNIIQFCDEHYDGLKYVKSDEIEYILYSVYFLSNSKAQILENYQKKDTLIFKTVVRNINSWEKENTFPRHMFSLSIRGTSDIAARCYRELLNSDEKLSCVVQEVDRMRSSLALYKFDFKNDLITYTCNPSSVLIFLLTQMSEHELQQYFLDPEKLNNLNFSISSYFRWIIDSWPWEELFFTVFEVVKVHITKKDALSVLKEIIKKMTRYEFENATHCRMLYAVLEEIRRHTTNGEPHLIPTYTKGDEFIELFDINILKLIKESECQDDEARKKFIEPTYDNRFGQLVRENQFERIDKFMEVVLTSDEERKVFKKYFKWHADLVRNSQFQALDNLLNWQCESEEEKRNCKYSAIVDADLMGVCSQFYVNNRIDLAEEAKRWGFSDEQERKTYINDYNPAKAIWLSDIWKDCLRESANAEYCIEKGKKITFGFLKWFLETDENVAKFKRDKLSGENFARIYSGKRLESIPRLNLYAKIFSDL